MLKKVDAEVFLLESLSGKIDALHIVFNDGTYSIMIMPSAVAYAGALGEVTEYTVGAAVTRVLTAQCKRDNLEETAMN